MGIVLLVTMVYVMIKTSGELKRESAVITQYYGADKLRSLVFLFPFLALPLLARTLFPAAMYFLPLAIAFFVFVYFTARKQRLGLECSGTDRVKTAIAATSSVEVWSAIAAAWNLVALVYDVGTIAMIRAGTYS